MALQIDILLQQAIQAFQTGNLDRSASILNKILQVSPKNLPALHIIGLIRASQMQYKEAVHYLGRAAQINPRDASVQFNLAKALSDSGASEKSLQHYKEAIKLSPNNLDTWLNYGKTQATLGNQEDAIISFDRALLINPRSPEALLNKGASFIGYRKFDQALMYLDQCLSINSNLPEAWLNRGLALHELRRVKDAIWSYDQALKLWPNNDQLLIYKGVALHELFLFEDAVACYDQVLRNNSNNHIAWVNKGVSLHEQKFYSGALLCYEKAISLAPKFAEAYFNQSQTLKELMLPSAAKDALINTLQFAPDYQIARWAIPFLEIPILLSGPTDLNILSENFLAELGQLNNWLDENNKKIDYEVVGSTQPFYLAYQEKNNKPLLQKYGEICNRIMTQWQNLNKIQPNERKASGKIVIGIVSDHIRNHSVWQALIKGWLNHLDKNQFEINVFYLGHLVDDQTLFAINHSSAYVSEQPSLLSWANKIIEKNIEVLIYPEIGMHKLTTQLASLRLAPIQIGAWGHPETTGLPSIDYYISANLFETASSEGHYSEKLLNLPNLGCTYCRSDIIATDVDLSTLGINTSAPVLICPGTLFKYAPQYDHILVELASRLGKCNLVFFDQQADWTRIFKERLRKAFDTAGLNLEDFVVFLPWLQPDKFYALLEKSDVMLDSIGFSGFNTAMQAIDCGLPIAGWEGKFMRGRLASGVLKRLGLYDCIAGDEESYLNLVIRFIKDKEFHQTIVKKIIENRKILYDDIEPTNALASFLFKELRSGVNH